MLVCPRVLCLANKEQLIIRFYSAEIMRSKLTKYSHEGKIALNFALPLRVLA